MNRLSDPADVVGAVAAGVSRLVSESLDPTERDQCLDNLAGLYAEHTDVRHPFAPLGAEPLRTRDQLRRHFAAAPDFISGVQHFEATNAVIHRTSDAEVVVVEFRYVGVANGEPFDLPNIFVVRVHNGEITESRDYTDHVAFARAFGRLGALAAALAAEDEVAGASPPS